MTLKSNTRKKIFSLLLIIGLLIGGGITIFAEESQEIVYADCTESEEVGFFFLVYRILKNKSGDIFSLLAATVSLTLFLLVKQYLIPLLNRVVKFLSPDDKNLQDGVPFDDEEKDE